MVDLTPIYIANGIGIASIITTVFCNYTFLSSRRRDIRCVWLITVGTLFACIVDPIVYTIDGQPGLFFNLVNTLGNTYLFLVNAWLPFLWLEFLIVHLYGYNRAIGRRLWIYRIPPCILTILCFVNIFVPFIFEVGVDNIYNRLPFTKVFWVYLAVYILYSVIRYLIDRQTRHMIRYFPIGVFILPIAVGLLIQSFHYGLSTTWVAIAIAVSGVMMSLKTEDAYLDQLTGINNRAFLYSTEFYRRMNGVIMLDINNFKTINDKYGHDEGDDALILVAEVIAGASSDGGFAVRYAGDEFLAFSSRPEVSALEKICNDIDKGLDAINAAGRKPYELSVSYGYVNFDHRQESLDEAIKAADKKMYEAKKHYYETHGDRRRRNC